MGLTEQSGERERPRIGVFGGTFDPIHSGHLAIAEFALENARLDEVVFVPVGKPWLREEAPAASAAERCEMVRLAVSGRSGLSVSRVDVERPGVTYTVDTLDDLRRQRDETVDLVLILGSDAARTLDRWHEARRIPEMCEILVIGRPGETWPGDLSAGHPAASATYLEGPMVDVSATAARARLAAEQPVNDMLPVAVERYIVENGLYRIQRSKTENGEVVQTDTRADRLLERAKELDALRFGEFKLTSGQASSYYFDGRLLSLDPEGADLVSSLFMDEITAAECEAFGGPTVAAVPIVGALALRARQQGKQMTGFFVRDAAKEHGMGKRIEGSLQPGMKVAVFDDTVSTGGSLLSAIDAVQEAGCEVALVLCVLDRHQGGSDEVRRRGLPFYAAWEATPKGEIKPVRR
ncbi:MAG: nicotinate-nucleotide adenylyltransferase [Planctomycetota bacterium]|jgi:nicotinate-nucleotide adenylyltransferase